MARPDCLSFRRPWLLLSILFALFLATRGPVMFRQIPAQDEDYFAVPGWTILQEGLPRVPYMPARNLDSAFYRADKVLFTLPPLYFYWQALFYLVLGPTTGAARLASAVCGLFATAIVYLTGRRLLASQTAALWAAGLYLFSRIIYFPCVIARPDMLCGALGLLCLYSIIRFTEDSPSSAANERKQRLKWVCAAGLSGGLGMLTHPFALLFCLQAGIWLLISGSSWKSRIRNACIFTVSALAMFALWIPLILIDPDVFWIQFSNNVLNKAGPGLLERFVMPWAALRVQTVLFFEHAGKIQGVLMLLGLLVTAVTYCRLRRKQRTQRVPDGSQKNSATCSDSGRRGLLLVLSVSAMYLHVTLQGTHPTKGYWCYTGAFLFVCLGDAVSQLLAIVKSRVPTRAHRMGVGIAGILVCALMLPGSGLRTLAVTIRNWDEPNYNAPEFTRQLIQQFPSDARLIVDPAYIFAFHLAGHDTRLALNFAFFYDVRGAEYDYLIGGPYSLRDGVPGEMNAVYMHAAGDQSDLFACYSELYRAPDAPALPAPKPDAGAENQP